MALKNAKSKQDIIDVFNNLGYTDSHSIVNELEYQNNQLLILSKNHPEIKELSKKECYSLFNEIFNDYKNSIELSKTKGTYSIKVVDQCAQALHVATTACNDSYNNQMTWLWIGVIIGELPSAGWSTVAGLAASAALQIEKGNCLIQAGDEAAICAGTYVS